METQKTQIPRRREARWLTFQGVIWLWQARRPGLNARFFCWYCLGVVACPCGGKGFVYMRRGSVARYIAWVRVVDGILDLDGGNGGSWELRTFLHEVGFLKVQAEEEGNGGTLVIG